MSKNPIVGQIGHGGNLMVNATTAKKQNPGQTVIKTGSDLRNKGGK